MITRAGALDQGNLILNLQDVETRGIAQNVMFLAGSAINSIKNAQGQARPAARPRRHGPGDRGPPLGRACKDVPIDEHLDALADVARRKNLKALHESLRQRYPGMIS